MPKDIQAVVDKKVICFYENYVEKSQPTCFKTDQLKPVTLFEKPISYKVDMSTDTTAIHSFNTATGIAVFLAIIATILAVWLTRRGFKMTEFSFEFAMRQIEKSIIESKNNTEAISKSNALLINAQLDSVIIGNVMNSRQNWINTVRTLAVDLISELEMYGYMTENYFSNSFKTDNTKSESGKKELDEILDTSESIYKLTVSIEISLNPNDPNDVAIVNQIKKIQKEIKVINRGLLFNDFVQESLEVIQKNKCIFQIAVQKMLKEEWNKVKVGK